MTKTLTDISNQHEAKLSNSGVGQTNPSIKTDNLASLNGEDVAILTIFAHLMIIISPGNLTELAQPLDLGMQCVLKQGMKQSVHKHIVDEIWLTLIPECGRACLNLTPCLVIFEISL